MYKVTRRHRRSIAAVSAIMMAAALTLSACTAPRAWNMNKTQTAHQKTQSSELKDSGMSIGDAATVLLESDYAAFSDAAASIDNADTSGAGSEPSDISIPGQGTEAVPESETAMEVSGKYISKQYLAFRAALYAAASSDKEPVKAAEELIKRQVIEWKFAEENGLLPTDDEVTAYCDAMRADAESDIESRETMLMVVQNMSLNESEYFRVFQPRYEIPFILAEANISSYCSENDIEMPDASEADVKIKDEQYIHELEDKYSK